MYREIIAKALVLLLNNSHNCMEDTDRELRYIAVLLQDTSVKPLPLIQPKKPHKWRDDALSALCAQSRKAKLIWSEAGRPQVGPLLEEKCTS